MLLKAIFLFGAAVFTSAQVVDNTLTPKSTGRDVVEAVVDKIQKSGIFPDDREILRRIAYVESLFGNEKGTFRSGYTGGIWQVDLTGFKSTQINRQTGATPALKRIYDEIRIRFEIDWMTVTWEDLLKPLYSGLASRIFLADKPDAIPDDLQGQAEYWKKFYNTPAGKGTVEHFFKLVRELEDSDAHQSGGEIDLTLVIDGSGSIGISAFTSAKTAISSMVKTFNQREANIGVVVYSSNVAHVVPFNTTSSMDELVDTINGLSYPGSGTNTNAGMRAAINMYRGLEGRRESGIPRVMLVFTDGDWNEGLSPSTAAEEATHAGIITMAFGIGNGILDEELLRIANGKQENVIRTQDYDTLKQQIARIARRAKKVPKTPPIGVVQKEAFANSGEKRYFRLQVPPEGVTVDLQAASDTICGFYSYSVEQPSSALYDGIIQGGKTFIPARAPTSRRRREIGNETLTTEVPPTMLPLHLTLESQAPNTTVTMITEIGDTTDGASAEPGSTPELWPIGRYC